MFFDHDLDLYLVFVTSWLFANHAQRFHMKWDGSSIPAWYTRARERGLVVGVPPGVVFGVVWTVLYALIPLSFTFYYAHSYTDHVSHHHHHPYWWGLSALLFLINLELNNSWTLVFFGYTNLAGAAGQLAWYASIFMELGILGTAAAINVFMFLDHAWLAFGLWTPYTAWLLYALVLNFQFVMVQDKLGLSVPAVKASRT